VIGTTSYQPQEQAKKNKREEEKRMGQDHQPEGSERKKEKALGGKP